MNPTIDDVMSAFGKVTDKAVSIAIDRTGVVLPAGNGEHSQGIQRLPRELHTPPNKRPTRDPLALVITSASVSEGHYVPCAMADDGLSGHALAPVFMTPKEDASLTHAGGCQTFGHFLIAGLEDASSNKKSQIQFWDLSQLPGKPIPAMTIHRSGAQDVSTAGGCGLTSFETGTALVAATFHARTLDFYVSAQDPFTGWPFIKLFTWKADGADKSGWIDQNFGEYESVNLLTQKTGEVFMVGFNRDGNHNDWMGLFVSIRP